MTNTPALHPRRLETPNPAACALHGTGVSVVPARSGRHGGSKAGVRAITLPPCSPEFDASEPRAYGGVIASTLAGLAGKFVTLRRARGLGPYVRKLARLSKKVEHALYIYTRVKEAMAALRAPQELELELTREGEVLTPPVAPARPAFTWDVTPKEFYGFDDVLKRKGYDPRGTSLYWVERRVRTLKARARTSAKHTYMDAHGLRASTPKPTLGRGAPIIDAPVPEVKTFKPATCVMGEIWPLCHCPTRWRRTCP